jgi:hypothetical protein
MQDDANAWHLFVFDTALNRWYREDASHAVGFAMLDNLYMLTSDGKLWIVGNPASIPTGATAEAAFTYSAEFGDFTHKSIYKKGVSRIQLRLELDADSTMTASIQYDSDGTWHTVKTLTAETDKLTTVVAIAPVRCDHYRLKLSGTGGFNLYAINQEFYAGSDI